MPDELFVVIILMIAIGFIALIAFGLDRSAKKRGAMFTQKATVFSRIAAILVGVLLALFQILIAIYGSEVSVKMILVSFALFLYGIGAGKLLTWFQSR